jgi:hypothetical protein
MSERHELVRHFVATLAYRTQKALRDAPEGFEHFRTGNGARTPWEILCHMTSVLGYARAQFIGDDFEVDCCDDWPEEIRRFHDMLHDLSEIMESQRDPTDVDLTRILQGPLADAMTHVGQLAMLRRLAGHPVEPENFMRARIDGSNTSVHQPMPVSPGLRDGSGAAPLD